MTTSLNELTQELKILVTPETYYSIGVNRNERTCIIFDGTKWNVYYSERGKMEGLKEFSNSADAKIEFLKQVT